MTAAVAGAASLMLGLALVLGLAALVLSLAALVTGATLRYALRHRLLDVPNARSSHRVATPRGGGAGIAVAWLTAVLALVWTGMLSGATGWALAGGGGLVAVTGWRDDHAHIAPHWRLLVHTLAALWAVFWLGGYPALHIAGVTLPLGVAGGGLAVLAIVALTNVYNFMDGIDGLAAGQAVAAGGAGTLLLAAGGAQGLALASGALAAASAGFLLWNRPPARIFMGDTGSGLLGFGFAVLAVAGENAGAVPAVIWLILLAVFVLDASCTLLRRMVRGERWTQAHCSHAYQRLVQAGARHGQVTGGVLLVNALLLWPAAGLAWRYPPLQGVVGGALAAAGVAAWYVIQRRAARACAAPEPAVLHPDVQ